MALILPPRLNSQNKENLNTQTYFSLQIPFTHTQNLAFHFERLIFPPNFTVTLINIMPKGLVQVVKPKVSLIRPTGSEGPSPKIDSQHFLTLLHFSQKRIWNTGKNHFPTCNTHLQRHQKAFGVNASEHLTHSPSYPGIPQPSKLQSSAPSINLSPHLACSKTHLGRCRAG